MTRLFDYWRSSASYRVRIALGLSGLSWETTSINLVNGDQQSTQHLERNPQGLVPVLEIDGLRFTQSLAIVEYLNETRSLNLLPDAPKDRAQVRALSYALAMEIHPVCNLKVAKYAVAQSDGRVTMKSWMQEFIGPGLLAFEHMLDSGPFCHGDRVSLADLCLMPQLYNAHRWEVDMTEMPKIRRIEKTLSDIPVFAAAHPDNTPQ